MRDKTIEIEYGHRARIRVCGIYIKNDSLLLIKHRGLNKQNELWLPPGGGLHYGESTHACLQREFLEETGLSVKIGDQLCICEILDPPLHAIELFFLINEASGKPTKGVDPELSSSNQIIEDVDFLSFKQLSELPDSMKHGLLKNVMKTEDLLSKKGYFKFP